MNMTPALTAIAGLFLLCTAAYAAAAVRLVQRKPLLPPRGNLPGKWHAGWSVAAFLLFVAAQVVAYNTVAPGGSGQSFPIALLFLVYVFNLITLAIIFAVASLNGTDALAALGLKSGRIVANIARGAWLFLLFLPLQFAYLFVVQIVWGLLTDKPFPRQEVAKTMAEATGFHFLVLAVVASVVAPFFEELVFRAFMQRGFEKTFGAQVGIAATVFLFAISHGANGPLMVLPLALALSLIYYRTRNIFITMGFHASLNLTSVILVLSASTPPS